MIKTAFVITLLFLLNSISTSAQYTKIHDFEGGLNGSFSYSNLFFDGTYLYGTTIIGGLYNDGIIFKIKPDGTNYTKIFDFNDTVSGNKAYGTLISDGIYLYGTTKGDEGLSNLGSVFRIKPDGTDFSTLHSFDGPNGNTPWSGLYLINDYLYGMTNYGGTDGTIYKLKTDGTNFEILFNFSETISGRSPYGELIYDGTYFYGTTAQGGLYYNGTVFKILTDGTGYEKLVDFSSAPNGNFPYGSLISDGTYLYGTTGTGGSYDLGSVFKVKTDGTDYQVIHSFSGIDGQLPHDNLVFLGGFMYGLTMLGGTNNLGTIFRLNPDGSNFSNLIDFDGTNLGSYPRKSVISDGTHLYGLTSNGGIYNGGVIFKLTIEDLGNEELDGLTAIEVHPNPFSESIQLKLPSNDFYTLSILDLNGEICLISSFSGIETEIDTKTLSQGFYMLEVKSATISKKLKIVKHTTPY